MQMIFSTNWAAEGKKKSADSTDCTTMHDKAGRTHRYTAHHHTHYYIRSKPEIMPTTSFSHFSYFTWCIVFLAALCCHHPFARVPGLEFRPGGTVLKFVCNKNWNLPWIGIYISINAIKVIVFFATFCYHHPFLPCQAHNLEVWRPGGPFEDGCDSSQSRCCKKSLKIFIFHLMLIFPYCSLLPPHFLPCLPEVRKPSGTFGDGWDSSQSICNYQKTISK